MKLGPEQAVQMPMKTVLSLIVIVSAFTFSYFQITERLNKLETQDTLMQSDLLKKAEQTPKNLEIFMLLEESFKQIEKLEKIGGLSSIVPSEGIVFKYKGNTYKFTGAFAPVNQIVGLLNF